MSEFKGFLKLLEKECIKGKRLIPIPHDYAMDILSHIKLLEGENQQLKKQKDDVVENAKEKIKRYESYIHDLKNGNYPSPTVRQERQELIFRIREQEDILRMLGEIDETSIHK